MTTAEKLAYIQGLVKRTEDLTGVAPDVLRMGQEAVEHFFGVSHGFSLCSKITSCYRVPVADALAKLGG